MQLITPYKKSTKIAFMNAATAARQKGKTWRIAYAAAKAVGYKGSLRGISQIIRVYKQKHRASPPARLGRPPKRQRRSPARPERPSRRPGRRRAGAISSLEAVINQIVKDRVSTVVDRAIGILKTGVP